VNIKILLADDHQIVRQGLKAMLNNHPQMEVIGECGDGKTALEMVRELNPDIAIMDITMPELNGIDATKKIVSSYPETKVIALSMHSDRRFVNEMLKAGASAYLLKDNAFDELILAVLTVYNHQIFLSPQITKNLVEDYLSNKINNSESVFSLLTHREREILQLMVEGKTSKEIAAVINLSVKTVETHRQNVMAKLKIDNLPQLVKYAIREGLTSL